MGGGLVTNFVEMVKGYAFEGAEGDGFRLETVIFEVPSVRSMQFFNFFLLLSGDVSRTG